MADPEGFIRRWSRRKSAAREDTAAPEQDRQPGSGEAEAPAPATRAPAGAADTPARRDPEPLDLDSLPDIESLTYESDYTQFMRKGVPAELRKRALQRLWRSSPTLANLDGLVEYGDDYTKIGTVKSVVRTAYQVGRGMLHDRAIEPPEQPSSEAPDAQPPAAATQAAPSAEAPAAAAAEHDDRAADSQQGGTKVPGRERA